VERLKDPMLTPTSQYAGATQGNQDAMTAPGSPNVLPVAPFNVPMDLVATPGPANNPTVNNVRDRIKNNPGPKDQSATSGSAGGWVSVEDEPSPGPWRKL
jgi:hypothetical protein